jgi:uncharacterized membrane protein
MIFVTLFLATWFFIGFVGTLVAIKVDGASTFGLYLQWTMCGPLVFFILLLDFIKAHGDNIDEALAKPFEYLSFKLFGKPNE